jgi:hypothetical protein
MIQPPLEVAGIVRTYGAACVKRHGRWITGLHLKVLRASSLPRLLLRATNPAALSVPTTPEPHSKHIIFTGGFAQPVLSPVFRPEAVGAIAEQVAGLNTGDRALVGSRKLAPFVRRSLGFRVLCAFFVNH